MCSRMSTKVLSNKIISIGISVGTIFISSNPFNSSSSVEKIIHVYKRLFAMIENKVTRLNVYKIDSCDICKTQKTKITLFEKKVVIFLKSNLNFVFIRINL